jgi:hypothetical protein
MTADAHLTRATTEMWVPDAKLVVLESDGADAYELLDPLKSPIASIAMTLDRGRTFSEEWHTEITHSLRGWRLTIRSTTGSALAQAQPTGIPTRYRINTPDTTADLRRARAEHPWRLLDERELIASFRVGARLARTTGRLGEVTIAHGARSQPEPLHLLITALICIYAETRTPAAGFAGPPS